MPCRAGRLRAESERGGDAAPVHDPAGEQHGHGDAIDDPGHERDPPTIGILERAEERAAMTARLAGLGDDRVHAEPLELDGLVDGRRRAEDDAARVPDLLEAAGRRT